MAASTLSLAIVSGASGLVGACVGAAAALLGERMRLGAATDKETRDALRADYREILRTVARTRGWLIDLKQETTFWRTVGRLAGEDVQGPRWTAVVDACQPRLTALEADWSEVVLLAAGTGAGSLLERCEGALRPVRFLSLVFQPADQPMTPDQIVTHVDRFADEAIDNLQAIRSEIVTALTPG